MSDETEFFNTVRRAIATGADHLLQLPSLPEHSKPDYSEITEVISRRTVQDQIKLVELFQDNAQPLNIKTTVVNTHKEAAAAVVELIRSKDPEFSHNKHIILHDHPDLEALQLWKRFNREAVTVHTSFAPDSEIREKTIASFIGITAPDIGIAESATLVEIGRSGRPRSTSLVPSIHIAVLKRENLVADLQQAYALLNDHSRLDSVVFITGPSKTADIEAHMVYGAHGPREMHIIIISSPLPDEELLQTSNTDK